MRVARGAIRLTMMPLVLAFLLVPLAPLGGLLAAGVAAAILWFHRDPERSIPSGGPVAPADGRVRSVETTDQRLRLATFLNLDDVHVIRAPVGGTIVDCRYKPGSHRPAFTKSSEHNERLEIDIQTDNGTYTVVLIAGAFARRIHGYVEEGETVNLGQRIGHISFGSRVDVAFPPTIDRSTLTVEPGDRMLAGETRIVRMTDEPTHEKATDNL